MNTFGPPALALARGEGAHVWDADGKEYVDLLAGIAVNALGHAHPALVEAVTTQLSTLGHVSNFFATEPQVALAERLVAPPRLGRRRARVLQQLRRRGQRGGAQAHPAHRPHPARRRRGLVPRPHDGRARADLQGRLPRAVRAAARRRHLRAVRRRRRARGGRRRHRRRRSCSSRSRARPASSCPSPDYLAAAQRIAHDHGALLWLDEVQTGIAPHRRVVRPPAPRRRRARRRHARQGPRRRHPDRRHRRPRRRGHAAPARQPRHHLRRQPGRLRGRARGPRHDRRRRPARRHPRPRRPARRAARRADRRRRGDRRRA